MNERQILRGSGSKNNNLVDIQSLWSSVCFIVQHHNVIPTVYASKKDNWAPQSAFIFGAGHPFATPLNGGDIDRFLFSRKEQTERNLQRESIVDKRKQLGRTQLIIETRFLIRRTSQRDTQDLLEE